MFLALQTALTFASVEALPAPERIRSLVRRMGPTMTNTQVLERLRLTGLPADSGCVNRVSYTVPLSKKTILYLLFQVDWRDSEFKLNKVMIVEDGRKQPLLFIDHNKK